VIKYFKDVKLRFEALHDKHSIPVFVAWMHDNVHSLRSMVHWPIGFSVFVVL